MEIRSKVVRVYSLVRLMPNERCISYDKHVPSKRTYILDSVYLALNLADTLVCLVFAGEVFWLNYFVRRIFSRKTFCCRDSFIGYIQV